MIINQPKAIILEALDLLFKAGDVIIMNYDVHSLGLLHPCLVLEVQSSCWECCLRKQVEIHLQNILLMYDYQKIKS